MENSSALAGGLGAGGESLQTLGVEDDRYLGLLKGRYAVAVIRRSCY